jgi:hypothetical protein
MLILSVRLYHQHCDNFCEMQRCSAKFHSAAVIYLWHFVVLSSGIPCMVIYSTLPMGQMVMPAVSFISVLVCVDMVYSVHILLR